MAASGTGSLIVGFQDAHLASISSEAVVTDLVAFDQVQGRDTWTNPAGPSPDLRSIAISDSDSWYVTVHVGGLWRSDDKGESWRQVIPASSDVHEVVTGDNGTVAVAAAIGFGWSKDGGDNWQWTTQGLHACYARAVALGGDIVFLTASTGPETTDGRLFRAQLGGEFEPCTSGLPESFPFNLDTGSIAASGTEVALGTRNGRVFRSSDSGTSWELSAEGMRPVQVLRFS